MFHLLEVMVASKHYRILHGLIFSLSHYKIGGEVSLFWWNPLVFFATINWFSFTERTRLKKLSQLTFSKDESSICISPAPRLRRRRPLSRKVVCYSSWKEKLLVTQVTCKRVYTFTRGIYCAGINYLVLLAGPVETPTIPRFSSSIHVAPTTSSIETKLTASLSATVRVT